MQRMELSWLALVAACAAVAPPGCTTIEPADIEAPAATTAVWAPNSPFSQQQLEQLCNDPEHELSRPPQGGVCNVELRLVETEFVTGQGVTEGRGEISFSASATMAGQPGAPTTTVSGGEETYNVGQEAGHELDLGTYAVPVGQSRPVDVCVSFVEHDNGGANGGNDLASGCEVITLRCRGTDANGDGLPDGQAAGTETIGPLQLCGDKVCLGSVSATVQVLPADADMDGVPNDDDFTPELCDEERKGEEGIGALVYFHYGDSGIARLVQTFGASLSTVYASYDYVVLVADNDASNAMNLDGPSFGNADRTYPPNQEGLLDAMQDLTSKGFRFDTFVFSHGYKATAVDSNFEVISGPNISGDWLIGATDPNDIGTARHGVPIMAWWSTTCIAARQVDAWMVVGSKAESGTEDVDFYPNAWQAFITSWVAGVEYKLAVDSSKSPTVISLAEFAVRQQGEQDPFMCLNDDPSTSVPNDGPGVVTDKNACAEDFFNDDVGPNKALYDIWEVYDHSKSGAENMAISSKRRFMGDNHLTFGAPGKTWP